MVTPGAADPPSENTPIATAPEDETSSIAEQRQQAAAASSSPSASHPASHPRRYRGGFTSSICDIFRDPHQRTDCCAVACCGVLSSDRNRYLLTGERPPPLWSRVLVYLVTPALIIAAMSYFAVDVPVGDDGETVKSPPGWTSLSLLIYIVAVSVYGCVRNKSARKAIMQKLYEERSIERGEEVDPQQLQLFMRRHDLDNQRAQSCCACCYTHDYDYYDETGTVNRDGQEEEREFDADFCTRLWDCLSKAFWCCGAWCQCCGVCAVAQEEREVNRLTGNQEHKSDYLTFQPYSDYYPSIQNLVALQDKSPWKHLQAISDLSSKLLKNVVAVLAVLTIFALSDIDSNFSWENIIILFLTLGQAFFIEYLVHWKWNIFDLSFDSVVKYFACGFFLTTPSAVVFEMVVSTLASVMALVLGLLLISSDRELMDEFQSDRKKATKHFMVNYPVLFIFIQFVNAFAVAALVEEMVKYFGYRMVVTPDLLPVGSAPSSRNGNGGEAEPVGGGSAKSAKSTGAGITVAMVSVALGFACCENLIYIFVYSPPGVGVEISTLIARSLFPVHPLCAAIQSIGVCKRDLEGDKNIGLGRILFPAILLHGSFDFVLMAAAYFLQAEKIKEGNDDDGNGEPGDEDLTEDIGEQLPSMIVGLVFVIIGYAYYVTQSRAQTQRLVAMDNAAMEQNSLLV